MAGDRMTSEYRLLDEAWSERIRRGHSYETCDGWQYGTVWRFAVPGDDNPVMGPPAGDGWELNVDFRGGAVEEKSPRWSQGDVVMQLTHWRRRFPGAMPGTVRSVNERVRWDGDPRRTGPATRTAVQPKEEQ
jgi:hypothetical protein